MNIINILPSTARDEYACLTPAEVAELEAWFNWVDEVNGEQVADAA